MTTLAFFNDQLVQFLKTSYFDDAEEEEDDPFDPFDPFPFPFTFSFTEPLAAIDSESELSLSLSLCQYLGRRVDFARRQNPKGLKAKPFLKSVCKTLF